MSKANLDVVLATPGPFVPGDVVEGFVGVTVNKSCTCRALTVTLEWYTHGRGNRKTGVVEVSTVFAGDLVAGDKGLHPFAMTVPPGPLSYEGTHVSVGWRVRANADLPWAFDPKNEATFVLLAGSEPLERFEHGPQPMSGSRTLQHVDLIRLVFGSVFMTIPLLFLAPLVVGFGLACVASPGVGNLFPFAATSFMLLVFSFAGYRILKPPFVRLVGARRLSEFEVTVPDTISPGQTIDVRLQVTPRKDILAEEVRVELRRVETAVSGSGTKKTTHRHVDTLNTVVLNHAGTLQARRPVTFSGQLDIPQTAGTTFSASQNSVAYQLVGIVDCPGIFDPEKTTGVTAVPANLIRGR